MSEHNKAIDEITKQVSFIERQLNGTDHADIVQSLIKKFAVEYSFDNDHQTHEFEWEWREFSRDDNEYYSESMSSQFRSACESALRKFKAIAGEHPFSYETSSEYGWLIISIPQTVNCDKDKKALFKSAIQNYGLRETSTDKVINAANDYVVVNKDASTPFLTRIDTVCKLLGLTPRVKHHDRYIQISI